MKSKSNIAIIILVISACIAVMIVVIAASPSKRRNAPESSSDALTVISVTPQPPDDPASLAEPEDSFPAAESGGSSQSSGHQHDDIGQTIADTARELLGVPFAENGCDPEGFDNSGLIYYVLRQNGFITCPRTTEAQSEMGTKTGRDSLSPGDLVFFCDGESGTADFGGIYIGGGKMIACLMPDTVVKEIDITTDYYAENFICGICLS